MSQLKLAVFADGEVGYRAIEFLKQSYPDHLMAVFVTEHSQIRDKLTKLGIHQDSIHSNTLRGEEKIKLLRSLELDYILLAWWPHIIKQPIITIPQKGVLNFHPSYLPYNRGKHYNFWTILEDTPFGVTIHFVNEKIDSGDIVFQKRIAKNWEDTGKSLYRKAATAMVELFIESYPLLIANQFSRIPQNLTEGSFHYAKELEPASEITLDYSYMCKDLLNLIRARVFPPHPSCWFYHNKRKFNVTIEIGESHKSQLPEDCLEISLTQSCKAKDLLLPCKHSNNTNRCFYFNNDDKTYKVFLTIAPEANKFCVEFQEGS